MFRTVALEAYQDFLFPNRGRAQTVAYWGGGGGGGSREFFRETSFVPGFSPQLQTRSRTPEPSGRPRLQPNKPNNGEPSGKEHGA